MLKDNKTNQYLDNKYIHILVWFIILAIPFFFSERGADFSWANFWKSTSVTLYFMLIFYINYLYLIEKFLFKRKTLEFILINVLIIVAIALLMHFTYEFITNLNLDNRPPRRRRRIPPLFTIVVRNVFSLIMVTGLSVAIKMSGRWIQVDNERKELERAKAEAELQNLKSQVNPHFLLNTLNNIYALIDFDPTKAQQAVQDLSKLLRHLLYDNNQTFVSLSREVNFMQNYIDLMRIRLSDNIKLSTSFQLQPSSNTQIAPLIFISLIENAFKHGISGDKSSFINIKLIEKPDGVVSFTCENSYFPKTESDKSGKGIGLQQVQKRLDLLYPDKYLWDKQIKDNVYSTLIIIDTKKDSKDDTKLLGS